MPSEMIVLCFNILQTNIKTKFFTFYFSPNLRNNTTPQSHKRASLYGVYGRKTNKRLRDNLETLIDVSVIIVMMYHFN